MRKPPPLPNRNFVVDLPNSVNERIIKGYFSDHDPFFSRLLGLVTGLEANLLRPPVIKCGDRQNCEVVPFKRKRVLRRGLLQFLQERENICTPGVSQCSNSRFWVRHELVPLALDLRNPAEPTLH